MNPPKPVEQSLETLEVEVIAALLFADQRPLAGAIGLLDWRLNGELTRLVQGGALRGERGEKLLLRAGNKLHSEWVLVLGGGKRHSCNGKLLHSAIREAMVSCRGAGFSSVVLALPSGVATAKEVVEHLAGEQLETQVVFIDDGAMA